MENMVKTALFNGVYEGKKVFITGHTGFKGSWLAYWLQQLGADVTGLALKPATNPNHYELLNLKCKNIYADIRDKNALINAIQSAKPEIILHLAAQALVRDSYADPVGTYETNVIGTMNLLETARNCPSIRAIVVVTSDKCYENREWLWGYRENEALGGKDPYSSSKACAELVTAAYRHSFFNTAKYGKEHNVLIASVRAGNVIGGGDWASDRIVPDMVKSAAKNEKLLIRNPQATRPWQHVLEPLSGYLLVGQHLLEENVSAAEAWNFGPNVENNIPVLDLVKESQKYWDSIDFTLDSAKDSPHEATFLMLDSAKANKLLHWRPIWNFEETVETSINWYRNYYEKNAISTESDLDSYISKARSINAIWTKS